MSWLSDQINQMFSMFEEVAPTNSVDEKLRRMNDHFMDMAQDTFTTLTTAHKAMYDMFTDRLDAMDARITELEGLEKPSVDLTPSDVNNG